ncbi:RHS repeat-associated core domain-containing protein [Phenylobacterium sp.]|uniref:RHS repeat-associated core domain-containing protein n=1 Tax=Phenylobacterium sp. TaxID=1871053 RepID=UPI0037C7C674
MATYYRYAGAQLALEQSANGTTLRSHVSGQGVDEQWMSFEGTGAGATPTWYLQDRQSSVIGVSDASGAITPYAYGPYGEPQSWSGSRFRYTGQIAIPEAQLYHYRARAYDPVMGRFLQTDPIGYDDGPNIYAYVGGDPVNANDPAGTCAVAFSDGGSCFTAPTAWTKVSEVVVTPKSLPAGGRTASSVVFTGTASSITFSVQISALDWKKVLEICKSCLEIIDIFTGNPTDPPEAEDIPERQQPVAPNPPRSTPGGSTPGSKTPPSSPGDKPPPVVVPRPPKPTPSDTSEAVPWIVGGAAVLGGVACVLAEPCGAGALLLLGIGGTLGAVATQ